MEMTVSDFGDVGKRVTLVGRLDILGSEEIDLPLAVVAGSGTSIVIDLGGVDHRLASYAPSRARGKSRRPQFPSPDSS
jgi:hypothetical protein